MNMISQNELNPQNINELEIASFTKVEGRVQSAQNDDKVNNLNAFGRDGLTFGDFIDIVNPLHHLPLIGTLYRDMTGDNIDPASKVLGGSLFLGPLGTVSALVNVLVDEATGKDVAEHAFAMFESANTDHSEAKKRKPNDLDVNAAPIIKNKTIYSKKLKHEENPNENIDPVTAWAIAEASYYQTASNKILMTNKPNYRQGKIERGFTANSLTQSVTEWAKSEVSLRKTLSKDAMEITKDTHRLLTQARLKKPKGKMSAMPMFNNFFVGEENSLALKTREIKKFSNIETKNLVAMYERQKSIPTSGFSKEPIKADATSTGGVIKTGGSWFSDNMKSALEKAKNTRTPNL